MLTLDYENFVPTYNFDGASIYYPPDAAAGVVTGVEGLMGTKAGLTFGAWIKPTALATGTTKAIIGRMAGPADYAYELDIFDAYPRLFTSKDGTTNTGSWDMPEATSTTIPLNTWSFIVGRWTTAYMDILVDNSIVVTATPTIPSIYNCAAPLTFGGRADGTCEFSGYMAYPFICSAYLDNNWISKIYQIQSKFF